MKNRIYKVMEAFKQGEEIKTYDMEVKGQWLTYNGVNKPVVIDGFKGMELYIHGDMVAEMNFHNPVLWFSLAGNRTMGTAGRLNRLFETLNTKAKIVYDDGELYLTTPEEKVNINENDWFSIGGKASILKKNFR